MGRFVKHLPLGMLAILYLREVSVQVFSSLLGACFLLDKWEVFFFFFFNNLDGSLLSDTSLGNITLCLCLPFLIS